MTIQKISFSANISKGKQEFDKLSREKQLGKLAIAKLRQERGRELGIPPYYHYDKSDLGAYVAIRAGIERAVEKLIFIKKLDELLKNLF